MDTGEADTDPSPNHYEAEEAVQPFTRISIHDSSLILFISPTVNQDWQQSLSGFLAPMLTSGYSLNHPKLDQSGSSTPHQDFQASPQSLVCCNSVKEPLSLHIAAKEWIYKNV